MNVAEAWIDDYWSYDSLEHCLTAVFRATGSMREETFGVHEASEWGVKAEALELAGESYLFFFNDVRHLEEHHVGRDINVRIRISPSLIRQLSQGREADLPLVLQPFLETDLAPFFYCAVGKMTPAMHIALHQLVTCPLEGMMHRMYIESKALELLALQFAQLRAQKAAQIRPSNLKAADVELIRQAHRVLITDLAQPPSVLELAQQVGINEFKLRQGFRQVFDDTVCGCLRSHQLQAAQRLLLDPDMTIAGIAAIVGYTNPAAFSTAFRKQFGISPKAYQKMMRH